MARGRTQRAAPTRPQGSAEASAPTSSQAPIAATLLVAALAALAYANTLVHGLVWDDPISIRRWLPALATTWDAFFPPGGIPQFPKDYYRPLQLLSYRLDRALGGGEPWAFHLSTVAWHVLASVLVLHCGLRLFRGERFASFAAMAAAVLFAVHPIHSESVAWMAARPDVMVAGLGLASLLAFGNARWNYGARLAIAMLLLLAALLCKENAVAFFLLLPASVYVTGHSRQELGSTVTLLTLLGMTVVGSVYLALRTYGLGSTASADIEMPANPLLLLVSAAGTYLRLLLVPYPQNAFIADVPTASLAIALALALLACGLAVLYRAWRRSDRVVLFLLAWIALTLTPSLLVIFKPPTAPMAERYLYLPSVAFCWLLALWAARHVERHPQQARPLALGIGAVAFVFFGLTVQRNRVWRDNMSLWTDTAAKNSHDGFALRNLATATLESGDAVAAERLFHAALKLRNSPRGQYSIYNNLGSLALNRGDDVAAEKHYRRALELQPGADCVFNLGLISLYRSNDAKLPTDTRDSQRREARRLFEEAISASPFDPDVHVALAQAAEGMGDKDTARKHFTEALRLGLPPSTAEAVRQRLDDMP